VSDYKAALKRIESLFDVAEPGSSEGGELKKLVTWVEAYEDAVDKEIIRRREGSPEIDVNLDEL
jgi:antitoxin component HigA of HigAB toxin-antitoxin module